LIHDEAFIAAIYTAELCGSNKIFFNCWISSRIKSNKSDPDCFRPDYLTEVSFT
jgi:hypothetical protein